MSSGTVKVLLVEDDPDDVRLVHEALDESGQSSSFEVAHVTRLRDARERLGRDPFDAVLLDLSLPDSSGLETFHHVEDQAPKVPIVVLTGLDDEAIGLQALDTGAQDYIVKEQLTGQLLVRALRYAVERHRLRVRLAEQALGLYISEARLRRIIDGIPIGMLIVDSRYKVVFINPAAEEILGRRAQDLLGEDWGVPLETGPGEPIAMGRPGDEKDMFEHRVAEVEWAGDTAYLVTLYRVSGPGLNS